MARLQGLGQNSCDIVEYNVVEVMLGLPRECRPVIFDALVVPDINRLCMPGAASFARELHSKGVSLTDWHLVKFDNVAVFHCVWWCYVVG